MERLKRILEYTAVALLSSWILFLAVFGSTVEIRADEESSSSTTSSSSSTGRSLYDALKAIYGDSSSSSSSSGSSSTTSSSSTVTLEQLMQKMETQPIGPTVEEASLDELYHEDYKVYEEKLGDTYTIYTNVKNGGVTNRPVVIDVPKGVGVSMKKDGSDMAFASKQVLESEGSYVMNLFIAANEDDARDFASRNYLRAKFRFRIQYSPGVAGIVGEGAEEEVSDNSLEEVPEYLPEDMIPDDFEYDESEFEALTETQEEPKVSTPPAEAELKSEYDNDTGYYRNVLRTGDYFYSNVPNGSITNDGVLIQEAEGLTYTAYMNGEPFEGFTPGEYIQSTGNFEIFVSKENDGAFSQMYSKGRPAIRFRIVNGPASDLRIITAPDGVTIRNVRRNGLDLSYEEAFIRKDTAYLSEDGEYELTFEDEAGSREVYFTLDTVQPIVSVGVRPNEATINYMSSDVTRAVLYKGNELISDPQLVRTVTKPGKYTLYAYDDAGNYSKSEFTVNYRINAAAVIAIIAVLALIAGVVIYLVRMKKKVKVV